MHVYTHTHLYYVYTDICIYLVYAFWFTPYTQEIIAVCISVKVVLCEFASRGKVKSNNGRSASKMRSPRSLINAKWRYPVAVLNVCTLLWFGESRYSSLNLTENEYFQRRLCVSDVANNGWSHVPDDINTFSMSDFINTY